MATLAQGSEGKLPHLSTVTRLSMQLYFHQQSEYKNLSSLSKPASAAGLVCGPPPIWQQVSRPETDRSAVIPSYKETTFVEIRRQRCTKPGHFTRPEVTYQPLPAVQALTPEAPS